MNSLNYSLTLVLAISSMGSAVLGLDISDAKLMTDGEPVSLTGKVVTYAAPDFLYIEEPLRNIGIRVEKESHGITSGAVDVSGSVETNTVGERYISAVSVVRTGDGSVQPVGMSSMAVGGADWYVVGTGGQIGITQSIGLNNVGLLVRVWGRFTMLDAVSFTIDDGSGRSIKCMVPEGQSLSSGWEYVAVTGVVSIYSAGAGGRLPLILATGVDVILPPESVPGGAYQGEMIFVPAGSFLMGNNGSEGYSSADELPQHSVYLSAYWIGKYEVTRGEYRQFMDAGGYSNPDYWSADGWSWKVNNGRTQPYAWDAQQDWGTGTFLQTDDHPVIGVTYYEAEAFCKWGGGHLPTEAQWEKASRWTGSASRVYPWGDLDDPEKCNNKEDTNPAGGGYQKNQTAPVGSYPSGVSPYGCHDMSGNVWEWCSDRYGSTYYSAAPEGGWIDPSGPTTGSFRVLRGGCWSTQTSQFYRSAERYSNNPVLGYTSFGFRMARAAP